MGNFTLATLKYLVVAFLLTAIVFSSCNLINPAEPVPIYIQVNKFDFIITDVSQGTAANKIEDVWVYVDDDLQGIYQVPAYVPVIGEGTHKVQLRPGIYFNGIKSNRFPYPFYSIYDTVFTFEPGHEYILSPVTSYNPGLAYTTENFDSPGGIIFDTTEFSDAPMLITNDVLEVYEGAGSGKTYVDSANSRFEIAANISAPVQGSARTFIEVHYKTSIPLTVGVIATGFTPDHIPVINLKPNTEWNKVYLEITNILHALSTAPSFRVYFNAAIYELNANGTVYLDNFKVIHN